MLRKLWARKWSGREDSNLRPTVPKTGNDIDTQGTKLQTKADQSPNISIGYGGNANPIPAIETSPALDQFLLPLPDAIDEINMRLPRAFGRLHDGYYPHSAVAALVAAITSSSLSIRQTLPDDPDCPTCYGRISSACPACNGTWANLDTPTPPRADLAAPELHRLKVDVKPMSDLLSGNKTCEIRRDDRGFEVGDHVHLTCSDGRETDRIISHIQRGYGLPGGLCVLSYRTDLAAPSAPAELEGLVRDCINADAFLSDFDTFSKERSALTRAATALTALQAENERLKASAEQGWAQQRYWSDRYIGAAERRDKAEAELAEAREKLGLAYETVAQVCVEGAARRRKQAQTLVGSESGNQYARWSSAALALEIAADDISALDPDATAALAARDKRVREEETRACAEVCNALVYSKQQMHGYKTSWGAMNCRDAIRARLDQPKSESGE